MRHFRIAEINPKPIDPIMKFNTILLFIAALIIAVPSAFASDGDRPLRVIAFGAHPDDADIKVGGTAAMLADMGHKVKFVSITNGNAGHHEEGGGMLASRRRAEAEEAARRLGIDSYKVLENHDGELEPTLDIRKDVIREIRNWKADVVLGHRPNDYHPDHRYSGVLVMDAAYMVIVPNIASDTPPLEHNPVFLYLEDRFTQPNPFRPDIVVGISDEYMERKMDALDAHVSQFYEWLPWTAGMLDEVPEDPDERREWLETVRARPNVEGEILERLEYWYGEGAGNRFEFAEAFEIAEYGRQPDEEDILRLFPMLER